MLLTLVLSARAELPVLSTDQAVALHISSYGLDKIGEAAAGILPPVVTIGAGEGVFECAEGEALNYQLTDLSIYLSVDEVAFTTQGDLLALEIFGTILK